VPGGDLRNASRLRSLGFSSGRLDRISSAQSAECRR
jgi:hypothetical protein